MFSTKNESSLAWLYEGGQAEGDRDGEYRQDEGYERGDDGEPKNGDEDHETGKRAETLSASNIFLNRSVDLILQAAVTDRDDFKSAR